MRARNTIGRRERVGFALKEGLLYFIGFMYSFGISGILFPYPRPGWVFLPGLGQVGMKPLA